MTDAELRAQAAAWCAAGRAADLIEVVQVWGSAPREAGARMLVAQDDARGTLGGGHLEWMATERARERLRRGDRQSVQAELALGPSLGQCCGGRVALRWQALDAEVLSGWPPVSPRFHLQLHGAGHVGQEVARLLAGLECRVQWVDERPDAWPHGADPAASSALQRVVTDDAVAEVATAPPQACFLVMTHRHDLDERIVEAILRRNDFRWAGLIGSQTKRARFMARLAERGLTPDRLSRLTCPIGLPGLQGKSPAVVAVSTVAQLLLVCPELSG